MRSRRLARRWTQDELARRLDYDVTYVRKIEWGERRASEAIRVRLAQVLGVPVSSLPPSAPAVSPSRLPEPGNPLIGRAREVEEILGLIEKGARLITVVGAPGIGKTRLALEVATRLDDRLPAGSRFASLLGEPDGGSIVRPIAECLGIVVPAGDEALDRLVDALAAQEILLVLDHFDHLLASAPLVGRLLAQVPTLRVLATSRQPLELRSETLYAVPPLVHPGPATDRPQDIAEASAVALFVASARKVRPEFILSPANAAAVARICAWSQGIPLAIELAAGATRLLTPDALLAQLSYGLDMPVAGGRDAPDHHRTLRHAIDWSFARLSSEEQTLLCRLAVFAGGCTIEAAAAVCRLPGETGIEPRAGLLRLAGKSLLESVPDGSGGTRFVALGTVREFALERLSTMAEAESVWRNYAAWCLELAEASERRLTGADQALALAVLATEHANLRAALTWALEHAPDVALRLCAALWRFWWIHGHIDEGRHWLEQALRPAPASPPPDAATQARALAGAGALARTQGDYGPAADVLERAAAVFRSLGDEKGLSLCVINLGIIAANQAEYGRASALFEESRALSEAIGDHRGVGHSLNCLGSVRLGEGQLQSSAELFEQALSIFREVGDDWSTAMVLANLGWVAQAQGRTAVAQLLYDKGLGMYRALGDDRGVANMLLNLATAGDPLGDGRGVAGLFEEALLIFFRLGERRCVAECLDGLAIARRAADPRTSAALLGASGSLRLATGAARWPVDQALHDGALAEIRAALGEADFDVAWEQGRTMGAEDVIALALRQEAGDP